MKVNSIISALPKLTPQELTILRAAIDHLLGNTPERTSPPLYSALTGLLGSKLPWATFRAGRAYKTYQRGANAVTAFIETHWGNERAVVKQAIMRFMLETLLDDLKVRGAPLTVGVCVGNLDRLPALLREQFPGYLEVGMAGLITQAMRRKR